ncbi:4-alpha-glucanotransferase, chloroplastic/amyloplastic [Tanacetum coccineum]
MAYTLTVSSPPLLHSSNPKLTNNTFTSPLKITPILRNRTSIPNCNVKAVMAVEKYAVGEDLPVDYAEWLPKSEASDKRRAGVLLHPTSFTGPYGIGDLGQQAFDFIDWLHNAGCSLWQVLPLVPPGRKANEEGSPYSGQDANCGNTLLISLEELVKDGLLMKEELPEPVEAERVNYNTVADIKDPLIAKAPHYDIYDVDLNCQFCFVTKTENNIMSIPTTYIRATNCIGGGHMEWVKLIDTYRVHLRSVIRFQMSSIDRLSINLIINGVCNKLYK